MKVHGRILEDAGIEVRDSNPEFTITHEKSMVIDNRIAFIKSLNWETKNFTETRDYAIITYHPHEVKEIILCFEADWHRQNFDPGENMSLIWCSNNGRTRIAKFIDEAKHTLFVQNERFQDLVIIERIGSCSKPWCESACDGAATSYAENGKTNGRCWWITDYG